MYYWHMCFAAMKDGLDHWGRSDVTVDWLDTFGFSSGG